MAEVKGLKSLEDKLAKLVASAQMDGSLDVAVGYTAAYALHVHENRQMKWRGLPRDRSVRLGKGGDYVTTGHDPAKRKKGLFWGPTGRAGFLLDVAREMVSELADIVRKTLQRGKGSSEHGLMGAALMAAGLRLQRESQKNVPVEYGNLRASAFTRLEQK